MRAVSAIDSLIAEIDQSLRTVLASAPVSKRTYPAEDNNTVSLTDKERALSARLMRINHAGEVAAQGLYRGQALTAKREDIRAQMARSAEEENDHLNWCETRIKELDSHKSYLNPVWYWGSFSIGALTGQLGDKWSLGFVKETEDQVVRHLESYMKKLPVADEPSLAIMQKMQADEQHHAEVATQAGAAKLPWLIRKITMPLTAKVMTTLSSF